MNRKQKMHLVPILFFVILILFASIANYIKSKPRLEAQEIDFEIQNIIDNTHLRPSDFRVSNLHFCGESPNSYMFGDFNSKSYKLCGTFFVDYPSEIKQYLNKRNSRGTLYVRERLEEIRCISEISGINYRFGGLVLPVGSQQEVVIHHDVRTKENRQLTICCYGVWSQKKACNNYFTP